MVLPRAVNTREDTPFTEDTMAQRKLSRSAQAARDNNYGTLANFRKVAATPFYKMLAGQYARKTGMKNKRAPLSPTSKFARLYGKAYLNKDGSPRKKPHETYRKTLKKTTSLTDVNLAEMEEY